MNTLVAAHLFEKLTYTASRQASVVSVETNSVYAGSTHHVLASNADSTTLRPPGAAYTFTDRLSHRFGKLSLSLNYLPSKFSGSSNARFRSAPVHSPTGMHSSKRDNADRVNDLRMPAPETLRWNKFKRVLFITNTLVSFVYFP